jgi:hypothetical protein
MTTSGRCATRTLGYLLNQCAHALNGIAKSCREQEVDPAALAEALGGVRWDLAAVSDVEVKIDFTRHPPRGLSPH